MKRAFTLVEMLVVVVILTILMSITFRLIKTGDEDKRRTKTVVRMQRLENCLSGYYAAFGSYPPVKIQGSRDIYSGVDRNGDQSEDAERANRLTWDNVEAACRSQPVRCEYPGDSSEDRAIQNWVEEFNRRAKNGTDFPNYANSKYKDIFKEGFKGPKASQFQGHYAEIDDWKVVKLFRFGLMSFLLPRYLFMMGGDQSFFGASSVGTGSGMKCFAQWGNNNDVPSHPFTGEIYPSWRKIIDNTQYDVKDTANKNRMELASVANIPSQAVCARWMPNLEGLCSAILSHDFFGVTVTSGDPNEVGLWLDDEYPPAPGTHAYPGTSGDAGVVYKNSFISVQDGWYNDFYYYSPSPHQSYTLWSAGSNGKTFPPWISIDTLRSEDRGTAEDWKHDDIIHMNN